MVTNCNVATVEDCWRSGGKLCAEVDGDVLSAPLSEEEGDDVFWPRLTEDEDDALYPRCASHRITGCNARKNTGTPWGPMYAPGTGDLCRACCAE